MVREVRLDITIDECSVREFWEYVYASPVAIQQYQREQGDPKCTATHWQVVAFPGHFRFFESALTSSTNSATSRNCL